MKSTPWPPLTSVPSGAAQAWTPWSACPAWKPCRPARPVGSPACAKALAQAGHSRRKKQHPDLVRNLERDAERLAETQALPSADKYLPLIYPEAATPLDYLPADTIFLIDDAPRLREAVGGYILRLAGDLTTLR